MFELWNLKWKRKRICDRYEKKLRKLRAENAPPDIINSLSYDQYTEARYFDEQIDNLVGLRLADEARAYDCPTPGIDEDEMWMLN